MKANQKARHTDIEKWVWFYWKEGINILPMKHGEKSPWLRSYKQYKTEFTSEQQQKTWLLEGKYQGIYALNGPISNNTTEIDIDAPDTSINDIFPPDDERKTKVWIGESSQGKKKIRIKVEHIGKSEDLQVSSVEYTKPDGKKGYPHVEYLGDARGSVLPPSIHYSGTPYQWLNLNEEGNLPDLQTIDGYALYQDVVARLRQKHNYILPEKPKGAGIVTLPTRKKKPKTCVIESHDNGDPWEDSEGHLFRVAVACDLIHCGYDDEAIIEFFRQHDEISGETHDRKITLKQITYARNRGYSRWECPKLKQKCGSIVTQYCDLCKQKSKEESDNALHVSTFSLPDGKHLEEILVECKECFILYDSNTDTWETIDEYQYGDTLIRPLSITPEMMESIILPDGVEEYGTTTELLNEMHAFALEEYDPVDFPELYELTIDLCLTSWISPRWQRGLSEKFIPVLNARGPSETGKKRYLTIMRWLTYHSLYALKTQRVPTLFRAISPLEGTLILDEADMSDSSLNAELVEYINSRCDGVSIPRYNSANELVDWWKSFGLTILATRQGFTDDGLESRCVVMPTSTTDRPGDYHLIPPKEWTEKGRRLQRKLLLFKLRHLNGEMPTQLLIPEISSFRVREALLIFQKLKDEDPEILKKVESLAKTLQERIIKERAATPEGLLLNYVYSVLDDEDSHPSIKKQSTSYMIYYLIKDNETKDEVTVPLTIGTISRGLGNAFSSSEIAKMWRGMQQDTYRMKRVGKRRHRGILLIKNLNRLEKIFPKYVVDYVKPYGLGQIDVNLDTYGGGG